MKCCGACFQDRFLQDEITRLSTEQGTCDVCSTNNAALVSADALADRFEMVCGIYEPNLNGRQLVDWLIDDWVMFSVPKAEANALLAEILDDGERVRQLFSPSSSCASDRLEVWERLRNELRTQNRFFPTTEFNRDRVASLLESLKMPSNEVPEMWYRARIEEGGDPFTPEKMGAPPAKNATPGRANPVGIPYLYVGSIRETAITEVRPHPGETMSVAEFSLRNELQIIDLRNPRKMVTPFILEDVEQVAAMRGDIDFLERLGVELTTPVLPNAAAIEYIPSQYLCEFIKQTGYDGVVYASSVSEGVNLALFDPLNATVGNVSRIYIERVSVAFHERATS